MLAVSHRKVIRDVFRFYFFELRDTSTIESSAGKRDGMSPEVLVIPCFGPLYIAISKILPPLTYLCQEERMRGYF